MSDALGPQVPPSISGYELSQDPIGKGSFGTVWLAHDAMEYRAIKVVPRQEDDNRLFRREYAAIRKYAPISRRYPGLVHILHVVLNKNDGFLYYVMELADNALTGEQLTGPEKYEPKTLPKNKRLPLEECLDIGIQLTEALAHLQAHRLIHGDIKLSNTIFVNGRVKLADISLLRGVDDKTKPFGTDGYVPPEGPGTKLADIYALGKVLYQIITGKACSDWPSVHTSLEEETNPPLFRQLNDIVTKACAKDPAQRYQSAQEMHDALVAVQAALCPSKEVAQQPKRTRLAILIEAVKAQPRYSYLGTVFLALFMVLLGVSISYDCRVAQYNSTVVEARKNWRAYNRPLELDEFVESIRVKGDAAVVAGIRTLEKLDKFDLSSPAIITNAFYEAVRDRIIEGSVLSYPEMKRHMYYVIHHGGNRLAVKTKEYVFLSLSGSLLAACLFCYGIVFRLPGINRRFLGYGTAAIGFLYLITLPVIADGVRLIIRAFSPCGH